MGDRKVNSYTEFTPEKKEKFLKSLSEWPNITKAAKSAGISRQTIYLTRESDPEFAKAMDKARQMGIDSLEDDSFNRTRKSDLMRIFMLKGNKPDKYKDRVEQENKGAVNVVFEMNLVESKKKD
jgi:L-rhamnose mutarotase